VTRVLRALVAAEARARPATLVLIALLVAATTGVALFCAAGARLTTSAPDRYLAEANLPDRELFNLPPEVTAADLVALPDVAAAELVTVYGMFPEGTSPEQFFPMFGRGERLGASPFVTEPLVRGRDPDPTEPLEVSLGERIARLLHVDVGDDLPMATFTPEGVSELGPMDIPDGSPLDLRVVGIVRQSGDLGSNETDIGITMLTPAFSRAYGDRVGALDHSALVRLEPGAGEDTVESLSTIAPDAIVDDLLTEPRVRTDLRPLTQFIATGLLALAAAVVAAGLVVAGQAMVRTAALGRDDDDALRAMGLRPAARRLRLGVPLALSGMVGVGVGVIGSVAASPLLPIGLARRLEPEHHVRMDLTVVAVALAGGLAAMTALAAMAAALATRRAPRASGSTSTLVQRVGRVGAPPTVTTALLFAQRRGSAGGSSRAAASAAVAAVVGVLAAVVFASSTTHLAATPRLYGWGWDAIIAPSTNSDVPAGSLPVAAAVADPDLLGVELVTRDSPVVAAGRPGGAPIPIVAAVEAGREASFRIVGVVLLPPPTDGGPTGVGLAVTAAGARRMGLERCGLDDCTDELHVRVADPGALARVHDRYAVDGDVPIEVQDPTAPSQVTRLREVDQIPWILAAFLSLLAVVSVSHAIVLAVRRRRRDFGVLRSLGFDGRQLRRVVGTQVVGLTLASCTIGVLLGVVTGRFVWSRLTSSMGLPDEASVPLLALVGVPLIVIAIAEVASVVPRRTAARITAAEVLRAE
jgi:hypothetical protein